jgi:hypothetical protein
VTDTKDQYQWRAKGFLPWPEQWHSISAIRPADLCSGKEIDQEV